MPYHDMIRGLSALQQPAPGSLRDGMTSGASTGMPNMAAVGQQELGGMRFQDGGPVPGAAAGTFLSDMAADPLAPPDEQMLIRTVKEAELALMGQHPSPERALQVFVQMFGEGALEKLAAGIAAQREDPRLVRGPGGPKDDKIPAKIDNVEEARLSDGEFVMTAEAVAGAGNGDPIEGARQLMRLNEMLSGKREDAELNVESVS